MTSADSAAFPAAASAPIGSATTPAYARKKSAGKEDVVGGSAASSCGPKLSALQCTTSSVPSCRLAAVAASSSGRTPDGPTGVAVSNRSPACSPGPGMHAQPQGMEPALVAIVKLNGQILSTTLDRSFGEGVRGCRGRDGRR